MILVTGSTGLLGSHLIHNLLCQGHKVRAIYRTEDSQKKTREVFSYYPTVDQKLFENIEWCQGDVLDVGSLFSAMQDVEEVYHCAGLVSFNRKDRNELLKVNVEGTANMVNTALQSGVKKFCHVSSIASFGRPENNKEEIDESRILTVDEISSVYAQSKFLSEMEVWRSMEEGLNAVIVNPSTIIGAGNWESGSSAIFRRVWKGLNFYTKGVNGFIDVRDVVLAMKTLMDKNIFRSQFILVSENISFKELLSCIAHNFNLVAPAWKAGPLLGSVLWRLEVVRSILTRSKPLITKESARIALDRQIYSNSKVKEILGLNFIPVMLSVQEAASHFPRSNRRASSPPPPAFQSAL